MEEKSTVRNERQLFYEGKTKALIFNEIKAFFVPFSYNFLKKERFFGKLGSFWEVKSVCFSHFYVAF